MSRTLYASQVQTQGVDLGNGLQGFQTPIENGSFLLDGVGSFGQMHSERGLTYFEVDPSGHM